MKRKSILIAACCLFFAWPLCPQQKTGSQSFDEFRKGMLDGYSNFRKSVLDDYDKFLEEAWANFEKFKAEDRFTDPKPADVPTAAPDAKPEAKVIPAPDKPKKKKPAAKPKPQPQVKPQPKPQPEAKPAVKPEPKPEVAPEPTPEVKLEPKAEVKLEPKPEVKPEPKAEPSKPAAPKEEKKPKQEKKPKVEKKKPEPKPEVKPQPKAEPTKPAAPKEEKKPKQEKKPKAEKKPKEDKKKPEPKPQPKPTPAAPTAQAPAAPAAETEFVEYKFPFYTVEFDIKDKLLSLDNKLKSPSDFAKQWRSFVSSDIKTILPEFKRIADENSLNDYLTFELIRSYVDNRYPNADQTARVALEHYLLANMGYDVRLAVDDDSTPLLLVPFRQYVYARPYLMLNDKKYYVFQPRGKALNPNTSIFTCKLPSDAELGRPLDLLLTELRIPQKMKDFHLSFGGVELNGQVNENIFPIVYNYPQMTIADFAKSTISPELRDNLVEQLKSQLGGMPEQEAVDKLLKFTQSAFEYATDGDFHGFEKPYFLEEILFYPKCDCEDRSIFYTYMLWNALGVESHLLAYPGHESASVHLSEPIKGTGYDYEGKHFYISDPTYIGSRSGMCMSSYVNTKPEIDYIYQ